MMLHFFIEFPDQALTIIKTFQKRKQILLGPDIEVHRPVTVQAWTFSLEMKVYLQPAVGLVIDLRTHVVKGVFLQGFEQYPGGG